MCVFVVFVFVASLHLTPEKCMYLKYLGSYGKEMKIGIGRFIVQGYQEILKNGCVWRK